MKYNAFISYSHRQDTDLGINLEKALEKFAKPTFKRRALNIFRDSNDLSAASDLGGKIRAGLDNSEYFIFMASVASAQSKWCQREIEYWKANKSMDNFLIALTDGEIFYDETTLDFDWDRTTALPKVISGSFTGEPLYTDFRDVGAKEQQTLKNQNFETKIVHIAATLHKKTVGDMVGEAVKQFKRTIRLRNGAIMVLSILLLIAVGASIYAIRQRNNAYLSSYIANSQAQFNQDPTKSLRLAEYAYEFAKRKNLPTKEASEQLIKVYYSGFGFYQSNQSPAFNFQKEVSPDWATNEVFLKIEDITEKINLRIPDDFYLSKTDKLHFDPATNQAVYLLAAPALSSPRIYFISYDPANNTSLLDSAEIRLEGFSGYTAYIQDIDISSDGKYAVLGSANAKTALIETEAYNDYFANSNIFKDRAILKTSTDYPISNTAFTKDDNFIITFSYDTEVENEYRKAVDSTYYYWKNEAFPYIEIRNAETEHRNISLDGNYYMKLVGEPRDEDFWFHYQQKVYDADNNGIIEFPDATGADIPGIKTSNAQFTANYQGVFNADNDLLIQLNLDIIDNPGVAYCFSSDDEFFKVSYLDGLQRIFPLNPEFIIERINNTEIMGTIAGFTEEEKSRFLIQD